jgi:SAM-dependent methyltransferase
MNNLYDEIYAKQSNAFRKRRISFYKKLASYISPTDRVVDIGCGNGLLALYSNYSFYIGVDFSHVAIEQAKKIVPQAVFICEDIKVFFKRNIDGTVYVMTEVLEHLENDIDTLSNIKKGGKVIISVPNNEPTIRGKPRSYPTHQRSYTIDNIKERYSIINFNELFIFENWIIGIGNKK